MTRETTSVKRQPASSDAVNPIVQEKRDRAMKSPIIANYPYLINASVYLHGKSIPVIRGTHVSTNGKTIELRDEFPELSSNLYKSLFLRAEHGHELAHIDLDSFAIIETINPRLLQTKRVRVISPTDPTYKSYFDILNIIEDARIEYLFGEDHPGLGAKLKLHNETFIYYMPRKHEASKGSRKSSSPSIEEQAKAAGIDPDSKYFNLEFAELAIIGRTIEPVEPDHMELFGKIIPKVLEYKNIRPPMIDGKIDRDSKEFKRLCDLYFEIVELIETKYKPALQDGSMSVSSPSAQSNQISPPNPISDPNNVKGQHVEETVKKVKQGERADSDKHGKQTGTSEHEITCPICGGVFKK